MITLPTILLMSPHIQTEPCSGGREPPSLTGFENQDGMWQLDTDYYRTFIEDVTGIDLHGTPSTQDIKLVQGRLEGCLEAYERDGDCTCQDFEQYEHVDSLETAHELARFFRVVVAVRIEDTELTH